MIDTIVLTLHKNMFSISDPDRFTPSATWAQADAPTIGYRMSKQNPTKKDLLYGAYKPRLTLSNRVQITTLRIELSLPKLLFGNNFTELQYKHFHLLNQQLVNILATMGIVTSAQQLASAAVSGIHYAKNVAITDGATPFYYIQKIKEANVKLTLDVNQTQYRNDGHSYKWHCNSYEIAFYDKIRDLEFARTSSRRAIEKDNELQLMLCNRLRTRRKYEILRMEVRLNKRQKIKRLLTKLNIKADLTFKKLFKPAISKKVLLHYLDEIEQKRPALLNYNAGVLATTNHHTDAGARRTLLADLVCNNPRMSPKQIMQLFGLKCALDVYTLRELRAMFPHCSPRSWYRLMAQANTIKRSPIKPGPFKIIRDQLVRFRAISIKSKFI